MKTKNKKMSIIIIGICAVLLCVLGVSIYHLTKKDNNESDYYLYINEDLVKDTYYYGEDFEFAQNMNIATLCKKEDSNTVYASSLSDGKNKKGQEIDNKDLVIEGFDSDTHGKKAVTVSYKQYSKIIEVDIKDCSITNISVLNENNLFVGEKVDKLELQIEYSDGHIILDEYHPHLGIDTSTTGTKTKKIYYPSYSIDWEYKVHEFDENCLDLGFVNNFSYPYGYDDENFLKGAIVHYSDFGISRDFPLYGKFDGSTLGEQIANFKVKKSDILNDPNNTDEVIIPYVYTVKYANSITCTSPDWFAVDNLPTSFEVVVSMDDINYPNQSCKVPIQLTEEQSSIGTHTYTINFAGQTTTHTYTIVGIESVEAYNWEDVYYYDKTKTKEKIVSNITLSTSKTSSTYKNIDNTKLKYYLQESYNGLNIENLHYTILNEDLTNISKIKTPPIYDGENISYYSSFFNFNINNIISINTKLYLYVSSTYYDSVPVKINYSNGESRIGRSKEIYDNVVIDCSKLGKHTLTLECMGKSFNYTYQVKELHSINVVNIDNVYEDDVPRVVELKVKAKDGTFNIAKADIVGHFVKNKKVSLYFKYLGEYYNYSTTNIAIKELICNDELVFEKNQKDITVHFTIKYADDTEKETSITFDNTQINTSKPIENAKLNFKLFGKYYTFEYDVLDYTIEVKDTSKTTYQFCPNPQVDYTITYSDGTSENKSYSLNNQIDTSSPATMTVNVVDGIYKFSYELTILPLGDGAKIKCINAPTFILGDRQPVRLQVLDVSNNPLYNVTLYNEYLDTSKIANNIEKTFTYCGMSCTYTYNVVNIGYIEFITPQVYYLDSQLNQLRFTVYSEGASSYTATLYKVDLKDFDLSKSTFGFNILTFTYCGYEIDFVYYYGERGNVELLKDNFTIEIPKDEPQNPPFIVLAKNTHIKLTIPMLITIGEYQFVDTQVNISMKIDEMEVGTYTYKFMYDDQEYEITYTIVDAE
ncbi:MAG: hypothetical protein IJ008_03310 [Clostridia bacterium]|nr:hypothetical protein [Clostridia bacterium]